MLDIGLRAAGKWGVISRVHALLQGLRRLIEALPVFASLILTTAVPAQHASTYRQLSVTKYAQSTGRFSRFYPKTWCQARRKLHGKICQVICGDQKARRNLQRLQLHVRGAVGPPERQWATQDATDHSRAVPPTEDVTHSAICPPTVFF